MNDSTLTPSQAAAIYVSKEWHSSMPDLTVRIIGWSGSPLITHLRYKNGIYVGVPEVRLPLRDMERQVLAIGVALQEQADTSGRTCRHLVEEPFIKKLFAKHGYTPSGWRKPLVKEFRDSTEQTNSWGLRVFRDNYI